MYDSIQISTINDFVFCKRSLYFHSIYYTFEDKHYKAKPQIAGTIKHEAVDEGRYSSRAKYLQGVAVFSQKENIIGKIDLYDKETKTLIERKSKIKKVYDGYRYQMYAQCVALEEMGYPVKQMFLHSLDDNKKYPVHYGGKEMFEFQKILLAIRAFDIGKSTPQTNTNKCQNCIYHELCRAL
jgi:CRISPR-associated protein Cas4